MKWFPSRKRRKPDAMSESLLKARDLWGIHPACVIDVGAAAGKWSLGCERVFPAAAYRLIEPLEEDLPMLRPILATRPAWRHIAAAAGAVPGTVSFSVAPDLDGSAVYGPDSEFPQRTVPVITLDSLDLPTGDCLLKLDTHGYEVPIFEGAAEVLRRTSLLIVEVYGQRIAPGSLLFHEICAHLAERGFRAADVIDVMRRPSDGTLWQADVFFLRADHPVFANHAYR